MAYKYLRIKLGSRLPVFAVLGEYQDVSPEYQPNSGKKGISKNKLLNKYREYLYNLINKN
jgi:hypothetical protein